MKETLSKELRLRKLFARAALEKGFWKEMIALDLFAFFGRYETVSLEAVKELWRQHLKAVNGEDYYIAFYLHFPFCRQQCEFCQHFRHICRPSYLDQYVQSMVREAEAFRDVFKNVNFKSFSFGGGTPNILSVEHLSKILQNVRSDFVFDEMGEKTFECNPFYSSLEKFKILADFGINKLTVGVQSLDEEVLSATNRGYQRRVLVEQCIQDAQSFKEFETINADLLIGLWNDSPQTVCESFLQLAQMGVDSISVYPLHPTPQYLKTHYQGRLDRHAKELSEKMSAFAQMVVPAAEKFGYAYLPLEESSVKAKSWDFLRQQEAFERKKRFVYENTEFLNDYFGIGVGSYSRLIHSTFYENKETEAFANNGAYFPDVEYRGRFHYPPIHERLYFMLEKFVLIGKISKSQYQTLFSYDIFEDFGEAFSRLSDLGAVTFQGDVIRFTPVQWRERFIYSLFFIESRAVYNSLQKLLRMR